MDHTINTTPTYLKMTLTIKEAAEYSNIGINKIDSMLRTPNCPFVLLSERKNLSNEWNSRNTSVIKRLSDASKIYKFPKRFFKETLE